MSAKTTQRPRHPELSRPPIVEVACGFLFEPVPGFDLLDIGRFWGELADEYPDAQLVPGIVDPWTGATPADLLVNLRGWFANGEASMVVQLQHDRLFINWQRGAGVTYPRFRSRGKRRGLRDRALALLDHYREYCADVHGAALTLRGYELSKVDRLERGGHWNSAAELVELIPQLGFIQRCGVEVDEPRVDVFTEGTRGSATIRLRWQSFIEEGRVASILWSSTGTSTATEASPSEALDALDDAVDAVFFEALTDRALELFGAH